MDCSPALKTPLALCASRINTPARIKRLEQMLTSWENQSQPCKLVLIIDALNDKLEQCAEKMLASVQQRVGAQLVVLRAPGKQFQKYAAAMPIITQLTGGDENAWLMFSDDDDLWHPKRVEVLVAIVAKVEEVAPERVEISTDLMCAEPRECASQYDTRPYDTADEVSDGVASGRLKLSNLKVGDVAEYVQSLVRTHCLRGYVTQSSPALIAHRYADMGFIPYIRVPGLNTSAFIPKNAFSGICWLYFYRRDESCSPLTSVVFNDEGRVDKLIARCGALSNNQRFLALNALVFIQLAIIGGKLNPCAGKWEDLWKQWEREAVEVTSSASEVMQARKYRGDLQSIIEADSLYSSLYPVSYVGLGAV
jgi:hypothetical protein